MNQFIDGAVMMGFCVIGLFFLRFWRRTSDRLFLMFCIAFWVMAINRFFLTYFSEPDTALPEHRTALYLVRLVAFCLILLAIIDKNRSVRREKAAR